MQPTVKLYRGRWVLYWHDGVSKRVSLRGPGGEPAKCREDAERIALDYQRTAIKPKGGLIGDLADKYFKDKKGRLASYDNMEFAWKAIKAKVAHIRPEHITREWCRDHTDAERLKGRADGTIRKQLMVLSAICRWSDKRSPAIIEMPPLPDPRNRYLTRDEAHKLIEGADAPHIRLFIILALSTAARHSALLELTWDRVDFDHGKIDLGRSVGNKGRATVPITDSARFALVAAREGALTKFVIEYAEAPVLSVKKGFANAARRAKLKDVTPHVLRHTAAVWMAEAGRSMSEIAQYLGHDNDKITQRVYARYSPGHLKQAAAALELDIGPKTVHLNRGALS